MAVLALLLYIVFSDRAQVNYVTTVAPREHGVVLELSVQGSSKKSRFAGWFPAALGLSPPPPRHHWNTALPSEVLLFLQVFVPGPIS